MKIGVPKETRTGETRVALIPSLLPALLRDKHEVIIESGAGVASGFADDLYAKAGARIVKTATGVYKEADIIFKVHPPPPRVRAARAKQTFSAMAAHTSVTWPLSPTPISSRS